MEKTNAIEKKSKTWFGGAKVLRIAIVDDEKPIQQRIKKFLKQFLTDRKMDFRIECFDSGENIVELGSELLQYDIFFLDIDMKKVNGIDAAKEIRKYSSEANIVFVTAFISYSLEGYKVDAIRYVLKDNDSLENGLEECMKAIIKKREFKEPKREFKFNECEKEIQIDKILYIESRLHLLKFKILEMEQGSFSMYDTLNNLERELVEYNTFVRVHQSFLVNIKHIRTVNNYCVILSNNEEIRVPKARYQTVKKAFIKYKREV